jgi:hypothetical protein
LVSKVQTKSLKLPGEGSWPGKRCFSTTAPFTVMRTSPSRPVGSSRARKRFEKRPRICPGRSAGDTSKRTATQRAWVSERSRGTAETGRVSAAAGRQSHALAARTSHREF